MDTERTIQLFRAAHADASAAAWVILGIVLPLLILLGLLLFFWIRRGGMSACSSEQLFAQQRELERWLRDTEEGAK